MDYFRPDQTLAIFRLEGYLMSLPFSQFAHSIFARTYQFNETETWNQCAFRVAKAVATNPHQESQFYEMIRDRIFIPGGRYLYSAGRKKFMNSNCYGFMVDDSREDWARLLHDATLCLSTGGGLGVNYSNIRAEGTPISTLGGTASGPLSLIQMVNEVARHVMAGGKRRSALWAGLHWTHPDIQKFISIKDWDEDIKALKSKRFEYPAPLDMTNISVIIDDLYLTQQKSNISLQKLHTQICDSMARTGEPAFRNQSRILQDDPEAFTGNACQESTLHDRDTCNLGSIVLPRIRDANHMEEITRLAIQFLYNGSVKATYPTAEIDQVAQRNRRIGLGVMGLHEFMLLNNHRYEWNLKLENYLRVWAQVSKHEAHRYSNTMAGPEPITTRAIAPTGTISIMAETTSGIEPIYCVAYKRRYLNANHHVFQYVIDPTAKRLLDLGIPAKDIEDTYSLSADIERRLHVQACVQDYVDQAISNTVNLPEWGTPGNDNPAYLANIILKYLPRLKGLTFYPDKARAGQPLTQVSLDEALGQEGTVFEEEGERCLNGICGL